MATKKRQDPWRVSTSSPFNSANETSMTGAPPDDDSFESNSYYSPNRGKPGYVQAEDGSWVPSNYWDNGGVRNNGRSGGARNPHGNVGGRGGGGGPCKPGYAMAEDGTCVPDDFWDKSKGKTSFNAKTGAPIKW